MFKGFKSFEFKISIFAIMKNFYAPLLFALLMAACTEEDDALSTTVANIPSFYGKAKVVYSSKDAEFLCQFGNLKYRIHYSDNVFGRLMLHKALTLNR